MNLGAMKSTRYPGYDVLKNINTPDWDEPTRKVVLERLAPYALQFFTAAQAELLEAISQRIIPQDERAAEARIRVAPSIDKKLIRDRRDGFRFDGLPPQREAWRFALKAIDESATHMFGHDFISLTPEQKDLVLKSVESGTPAGATWRELSAREFFKSMLLPYIVGAYYEHPLAWNETGYAGPAAKRGHVRTWEGGVDPWNQKASK